jgi:hypothetical protein
MALTLGTWKIVDGVVGAQKIDELSSTQKHALGKIVRAKDVGTTNYGEGEFIYAKGVASCAAKDWVGIPADNFTLVRAVANGNYPMGVAIAALTASYYGWVQIEGKAIGNCLTSFADNGQVYLTSTAGSVDDASVAGDFVVGAVGASAAVVGDLHAEFELSRPFAPQRVSVAG